MKLDQSRPATWEYDQEADTLYVSFGKPRPTLALDMGNGLLARYLQESREMLGFTIVGLSHVAKSRQVAAGE